MKLYCININPMNPFEIIINATNECVRMYDERRLSKGPIKIIQRRNTFDGVSWQIKNDWTSQQFNNFQLSDEDSNDTTHQRISTCNPDITSAVYNFSGTEILGSYSEDIIFL
jgi:WD repeat-containing protein 42A